MENKENNDEVTIKLEKQKLMREEIINKGYDSIKFIEYLIQCKSPSSYCSKRKKKDKNRIRKGRCPNSSK